jgi:hypothetical protein
LTITSDRFRLGLKMLLQLGIAPLSLYAIYRLGLRTGYYRRLDASLKAEAARAQSSIRSIFDLPDPTVLRASLSLAARAALLRDANAVVNGKHRIFGTEVVGLDFGTRRPLHHWTAYELDGAFLSPFLENHADIKYAWEPARFGWAYVLGRAFHLTRGEKYARAFWSHFERFDRSNPAFMGPHWMNAQEVAIRLMALAWCAHVLRDAQASTSRRLTRLARSIAEHAVRVPPTLPYARSQNNNHLITESTALYLAGAALDHPAWRELGWRWLNHALQQQISATGEYIQHSTNYHRLMLQSVLLADAVRRGRGELWPAKSLQALARASHWLFSMLDPISGRVPNLGANDGALILPLSSSSFEDYRPTVQAAARAFLRTALPAGDWDEPSVWLGLPEAAHTADASAYAAEHLRGKGSWTFLQASSFRSRLGHMDQLHLDLWWRGRNVAADAGTYRYNALAPWDNPLVASRVHNCVTVDGRDSMTRGGRFLVLDWFPAEAARSLATDSTVLGRITASHNGFNRVGIRYHRSVTLTERGRWLVQDDVRFIRPQPHSIRLHWLLLDGEWRLRQRGTETRLRIKVPGGAIDILITVSGPIASAPRLTLIRAGRLLQGEGRALPYEGWISPTYGRLEPALSLALEVQASHSFSFTTQFTLPG